MNRGVDMGVPFEKRLRMGLIDFEEDKVKNISSIC